MRQTIQPRELSSEELRDALYPVEGHEGAVVPVDPAAEAPDPAPVADIVDASDEVSAAMPKTVEAGAPAQSVAETIRARQAQATYTPAPKAPTAADIIAQRKASGAKVPTSAAEMIRQRKTGKAVGAASDPRSVIFARKYSCK